MSNTWVRFFFWLYLIALIWTDGTITSPADPDLWHRLALGEALFKTGHFPAGDYFSYMADYKSIADHEWGSAVVFYALYLWAGMSVFFYLKMVMLTLTLILVVKAGLFQREPSVLTAAFYALVLLALLPSFQPPIRCLTFTHLLFALWLYWFQKERHGFPVPIYLYVLTAVLWANLHGGFVIGLVWLGAVMVVEVIFRADWKTWFVRLGVCTLATLINPYGANLWISTGRALLTTRTGFQEWEPVSWWPDIVSYPGYKLLLIGLVITLIVQIYRRGWSKTDQQVVVLLGIFIGLFMISARNSTLLAVIAGALAPGLFRKEPLVEKGAHPVQHLVYMALGSVLLVFPLYAALVVSPRSGLDLEYPHISSPIDAVDYLRIRKIRGNLLVPFNYGSYALWNLRGQMRVSMDGRYDLVYRPETFRRVEDFFQAKGEWQKLLTSPMPDAILVPKDDPVYSRLLDEPGWKEAFQDDTDAVFLPLRVVSS